MKKILLIFLFALFLLPACTQNAESDADLRYFAPWVQFASARYDLDLDQESSVDVEVVLSRPATKAFEADLVFGGTLTEGVHYTTSTKTLKVQPGDTRLLIGLTMLPDSIIDAESSVEITLVPGTLYALDPQTNYKNVVTVTKTFQFPILKLVAPTGGIASNPFLAETFRVAIESHAPVKNNLSVQLQGDGLSFGEDVLIDGGSVMSFVIPAGKQQVEIALSIPFRDQPGYSKQGSLSIAPSEDYEVSASAGSVAFTLADPVVDFSNFLRTSTPNGGEGNQVYQSFKKKDGEWGDRKAVDLKTSSDGSNYLRNLRNMFHHGTFNCMANASVSQFLRMSELFPNYRRKSGIENQTTILDYGNDQDHREFTPADSVLRFVPDVNNPLKGEVRLYKKRTFTARIGSYDAWQDKSTGGEFAWVRDSRATGGNIAASTHPALTGMIDLVLEKVEGTYDFTVRSSAYVLLTAWFSSASDQFMAGFDTETFDAVQEDGCWKVKYRLVPDRN